MSKQGKMYLLRFTYKTKSEEELIPYLMKGVLLLLPEIKVYRHSGNEKEALQAFKGLQSCIVAHMGNEYLAFPAKGYFYLRRSLVKAINWRIERGMISPVEHICMMCRHKVRKALTGCINCDGDFSDITQLNAMRVISATQHQASEIEV